MSQLKMLLHVLPCAFPEDRNGFSCRKFTGSEEDIDIWLQICKNGLAAPTDGREKFEDSMRNQNGYRISDTYFVLYDKKEVGTVTAIVYDDLQQGYLHMVAARPEICGKGIGSYMADLAKYEFYTRNCKTALLKTDEFRVPAIKSYLRAGFLPVLYEDDMQERWNNWLNEYGYRDIAAVDENGNILMHLPEKLPL